MRNKHFCGWPNTYVIIYILNTCMYTHIYTCILFIVMHKSTHVYNMCVYIYVYIYIYIYIYINRLIGLVGRVFANDSGDLGSIPGRVIPKTLKMVLDTSLLNTQQYKVRIKGKVEQFWERGSALPLQLSVVAIEKGAFWSPSTKVANFTYLYIYIYTHTNKQTYIYVMQSNYV